MTTIIVTHENNEIDEYDFEADVKVITIGRRSTNSVCISNLSVSGNHAKITLTREGAQVEDLSSTNGTYINGRLISRQLLNDGDDIVLGNSRVTFLQPTQKVAPDTGQDTRQDTGQNRIPEGKAPEDHNRPVSLADRINPLVDKEFDKQPVGQSDSLSALSDDIDAAVANPVAVANPGFDNGASQHQSGNTANGAADAGQHDQTTYDEAQKFQRTVTHELDESEPADGAVIEIKNGAKSGQILPIDKPVTTLGRPGIQIAAIMKKPDGYFLLHIESDDNVKPPSLNSNAIGDEPVLLKSGDALNVAGIDVQFMQP